MWPPSLSVEAYTANTEGCPLDTAAVMHPMRLGAIVVVVGNPLSRYAVPHSISPLAFFGRRVVGGVGEVVSVFGTVVPVIAVPDAGGFWETPTLVPLEEPHAARTTARTGNRPRARRLVVRRVVA